MKIGVLMGGISDERDISLRSGKEIIKNLNRDKYSVYEIILNSKDEVIEKVKGMDFIFIALHGVFGEDGQVQRILDSIDMPYSGSGVYTSEICMNKNKTKEMLKDEDIAVGKSIIIKDDTKDIDQDIENIGYPLVVKPNSGGSSIATFLVNTKEELKQSINEVLKHDREAMVEEYLNGDEYTVPVLNGKAMPILRIKPKGEFFDYSSKYDDDGAEEYYEELPQDIQDKMNEIAIKAWKIFDCKAYVRVDIILREGVPYVLELNTLPGMTRNSLFPKSAREAGISYSELLDKIIIYSK